VARVGKFRGILPQLDEPLVRRNQIGGDRNVWGDGAAVPGSVIDWEPKKEKPAFNGELKAGRTKRLSRAA
jgi:hypothetical protein